MMFFRLFPFLAAIAGVVIAEVPSYLHVCGIKHPNLDECLMNSINALGDRLRRGIPELDILPIEPLDIGSFLLTDLPNFKAAGSNVKLNGISTYHVYFVHFDIEKQRIDMNLTTHDLSSTSLFNITTRILVPITATGDLTITTKKPSCQVTLTYVITNRGGKQYFYFSSLNVKINVIDFDIDFHGRNLDKTLEEAIKQTIRNNKKELLAASMVNLERAISKKCLQVMNNIIKHFTYDELFLPDQEIPN